MIACLLHSNGLVNSPMKLIATFKCGEEVRGREKQGVLRQAAVNLATQLSHLASFPSPALFLSLPPSLLSVPQPASHNPLGIKLELAKSSDMLITGLALL